MSGGVGNLVSDGVMSGFSGASRVSAVFPGLPPIKSYAEAAQDYYVVHPTSSFVLAPSDEYIRWGTRWGAAPSSCSVAGTFGKRELFGYEPSTTWSPSCWGLECPAPGRPYGSVAAPWMANPLQYGRL